MRPQVRPARVETLPITVDLLARLDALPVEQRNSVLEEADIPRASISAWRNGQYHPGAQALTRLYTALGRRLTSAGL